jgi:hypothetical protein
VRVVRKVLGKKMGGVESDTFVLVSGVKVEKTAKIDLVWDRECFQQSSIMKNSPQ